MAKETEGQVKAWVKDVATVAVTEGEDVTAKLKEVKAVYIAKAEKMEKTAWGDVKEGMLAGATFYRNCASAVQVLIEQKS